MRAVALVLMLLAAAPARGAEVAWLCDLTVAGSRNPVPAQLVIGHDERTGSVVVNDPVIAQYLGIPMRGRVERETAAEVVFLWTLQGPADTAHPAIPHIDYRAAIRKADGAIAVRAVQRGSLRPFAAQGICRREDVAF